MAAEEGFATVGLARFLILAVEEEGKVKTIRICHLL